LAALFIHLSSEAGFSGWLGCAGGADIRARAAILAFGRVDYKQAVDFRNRAFRAFRFAGSALNAFISDYVSHPLILSTIFKTLINRQKDSTRMAISSMVQS